MGFGSAHGCIGNDVMQGLMHLVHLAGDTRTAIGLMLLRSIGSISPLM
jgi:hypothetical protein